MSKVLFICPKFHESEISMLNTMRSIGHDVIDVTYYENDIFKINTMMKIYNKSSLIINNIIFGFDIARKKRYDSFLYRSNLSILIDKKLIDQDLKSIDIIFIVKGFGLKSDYLRELKNKTGARVIFYQWDSHKLYPGIELLYECADKVFYFERKDNRYTYMPNFHEYKYEKISQNIKEHKIVYIGAFNFSRLIQLLKVRFLIERAIEVDFRLYTSLSILGFLPFVINHKIDKIELCDIYKKAKFGLELKNKGQSGFTQRIFEYIGNNISIVVLNKEHKDELVNFEINKNIISIVKNVDEYSINKEIDFNVFHESQKKQMDFEISNWLLTILNLDDFVNVEN
ncbi:TPA: hypothetical protein ACX6RK_003082 [Photobacterium damselae]